MVPLETLTFLDDIQTEGKVIQLEYRGKPLLIVGRTSQNSDVLLARWCESQKILCTLREQIYYPVETSGITLVGAGRCKIPLEKAEGKRILLCGGVSAGYLLAINPEHLKQVQASLPDWKLIYQQESPSYSRT